MTDHREPQQHPIFRVEMTRPYVTHCVRALTQQGLPIDRSWLDPTDPRDATVVLDRTHALVWDEETGWRFGVFRSGCQGVRTELEGAAYLGGGPLPTPKELLHDLTAGKSRPRRKFRSYADQDGLDETLRTY